VVVAATPHLLTSDAPTPADTIRRAASLRSGCGHRALPGAALVVGVVVLVGVVGVVELGGLLGRLVGLVGLVGLVAVVGVGVGLGRPGPSPHQSATSFGYCSIGGGQRCPGG
jgi:hypothetical protein